MPTYTSCLNWPPPSWPLISWARTSWAASTSSRLRNEIAAIDEKCGTEPLEVSPPAKLRPPLDSLDELKESPVSHPVTNATTKNKTTQGTAKRSKKYLPIVKSLRPAAKHDL